MPICILWGQFGGEEEVEILGTWLWHSSSTWSTYWRSMLSRVTRRLINWKFDTWFAVRLNDNLTTQLTHWGRVTHICVGKLIIIGSDNGLSPDRRQASIWTNAGLLSIGRLRIYFSENLIKIQHFSLKKLHVKVSSAKWRPSCLGLNVLSYARFGYQESSLCGRHITLY